MPRECELPMTHEPVADRWVRGECSVLLSYISHVSELVAALAQCATRAEADRRRTES